MADGSWTEVQLEGPPGGFVATDMVNIIFDVGKTKSPVSVRELTMSACIRIGWLVHLLEIVLSFDFSTVI